MFRCRWFSPKPDAACSPSRARVIALIPYTPVIRPSGRLRRIGMREASDCRIWPAFTFRSSHGSTRTVAGVRAALERRTASVPSCPEPRSRVMGSASELSIKAIPGAAPGTTYGTTVRTSPGTPGHLKAWFSQVKFISPPFVAGQIPGLVSPYKREVTGSNPVAPTNFAAR
jgi:hypothetical protein